MAPQSTAAAAAQVGARDKNNIQLSAAPTTSGPSNFAPSSIEATCQLALPAPPSPPTGHALSVRVPDRLGACPRGARGAKSSVCAAHNSAGLRACGRTNERTNERGKNSRFAGRKLGEPASRRRRQIGFAGNLCVAAAATASLLQLVSPRTNDSRVQI